MIGILRVKPMRFLLLKRFVVVLAVLLAIPGTAAAGVERLTYRAELNSVLTLFAWAHVGTVTVTSRDVDICPGGGRCRQTEAWMTSESAPALETVYPLRYLYRTAYLPERGETLAFEILRNRRGADAYGWRHRVFWLHGQAETAIRYDLDAEGERASGDLADWAHTDKAGDLTLRVRNHREVSMRLPALDRLGGLDMLRAENLEPGASWRQAGAGPKGSLTFIVTVEEQEVIQAGMRSWETWRIRAEERREGDDGASAAPLYAWIATDAARTPVRLAIDHPIGQVRLTLQ